MEKGFDDADGSMSPLVLDPRSPNGHLGSVGSMSMPSLHIKVINAMDGLQHDVVLNASSSINTLRQELVLKTSIPSDDQILLYGPPYARLDPRKSVESYQLPHASKFIFLYDRRVLSQDRPSIPRVVLHPQTVELPTAAPSTSSSHAKLLQETSSPLLRALFDYESQFQQQLLMAEAVESTAKARLAATEACVEQLDTQTRGIQAALSNLDAHHTAMQGRFTPFWADFKHAQSDHSTLLEHFDTYVHRLGSIPLHPALASDTRLTLLDCIPLDRERDWLVSCKQSQASLEAKMDSLAASFRTLSDAITEQSSAVVSVAPSSWRHTVDEFAAKVAAISSMRDTLRQNYDAVSKRVADSTQQTMDEAAATAATASMNMSFMFGSTHILEACRGLDDLFRQQADVLPNMQNADDLLKTIMNSVADAKAEAYGVVCTNLKRVSELQCNIVAFETHLGMLKDALAYQKRQFAELKHVQLLPQAYDACVVEIKRRRQYGRLFQARINEMGEAMVGMRDAEIAKREAFLREHGQHLPRDLAPGLTEKPSHCIVSMRPFDTVFYIKKLKYIYILWIELACDRRRRHRRPAQRTASAQAALSSVGASSGNAPSRIGRAAQGIVSLRRFVLELVQFERQCRDSCRRRARRPQVSAGAGVGGDGRHIEPLERDPQRDRRGAPAQGRHVREGSEDWSSRRSAVGSAGYGAVAPVLDGHAAELAQEGRECAAAGRRCRLGQRRGPTRVPHAH
ncbi:hypothetical protein, variant 3 [Aphanomyces astaci]|uniref:Autophagy protein ATG17-like domain-containing protein n=1 Tax=Aphanomyces astaci TaxID=112090 RepID=W4H5J6_APHAT|nr:hypothetical protein, variant 2 [Aphanomyces astaci]XP_009824079.1 hypothetical protein, variant 3 [Aphanomyces astaci]ETV87280.1 hypothetical protein, variant 2 [Aphanomyces astaci]ETV87281.1 hypothetical protein, variant 3 [Aphanomyces astaci]|eukprot:XP_009824078.1 hypothetical protein, variant 2 [Aphanomyces astaci]